MPSAIPVSSLTRAATLVLVRPAESELQLYFLRRSSTSGFMPGLFVFPGGLVDAADCDDAFWEPRCDLTGKEIGRRLGRGIGFSEALGFGVAAVRETFEEAGVLFASRAGASDGGIEQACARRLQENGRRGWFRRMIASEDWELSLSALSPWSRWITPVGMPRRFDTRFFMAALPEGQDGRPDMHETTEGLWISPRPALAANLDGRIPLSPPTIVTLQALLGYSNLERLRTDLDARSWGDPIFPQMLSLEEGAGAVIIEPWDPMYGQEEIRIDAGRLPESVLPVGEPFSRLWNDGGIWKPVGYFS